MARISAIITVCNRMAFLAEAIDSVLAQARVDPLEIVVVDDGSTTPVQSRFATKYPMVKWVRTTSLGLCAARQVGSDAATGEYLCYLDDDDLWTVDKVAAQLRILEAHEEAPLVCTDGARFGENVDGPRLVFGDDPEFKEATREPAGNKPPAYFYAREALIPAFVKSRPFLPQSMMIRRSFLLKMGGWDRAIKGNGDALDFFLRANFHAGLGYIDAPLVKVRRGHGSTLTSQCGSWRYAECEALRNAMKHYPDGLKQALKPVMRPYLVAVAEACADSEHYDWAARTYREAMRHGNFSPGLTMKWLRAKMK